MCSYYLFCSFMQFVIFNDNARESTSSSYETAFAHAALMKIPDQFKDAKKLDLLG